VNLRGRPYYLAIFSGFSGRPKIITSQQLFAKIAALKLQQLFLYRFSIREITADVRCSAHRCWTDVQFAGNFGTAEHQFSC
jgi:hypothetical protein